MKTIEELFDHEKTFVIQKISINFGEIHFSSNQMERFLHYSWFKHIMIY